jgi:hypothetical protein
MKTTDTRSRRKTASLAWGVPSYAFGGRGEELSCTMMSTVQFKRFSEILLVQVDGGANALDMDWAPIVATVMRPLEYGTPRKVKFQPSKLVSSSTPPSRPYSQPIWIAIGFQRRLLPPSRPPFVRSSQTWQQCKPR